MKRFRSCCLLLSAILLSACGGSGDPGSATGDAAARFSLLGDGITARELLPEALAAAHAWSADAQLVAVSTRFASGPRQTFWFYDLQSPSLKRCTRLRVQADGEVENIGTGGACSLMPPLPAQFVDSTVVWQAAREAGFLPAGHAHLALHHQRDGVPGAPRSCWLLWSRQDGDGPGAPLHGWCVDPLSGAFVGELADGAAGPGSGRR
jgi:hypothetical protein